jgi:FkbM family methyltransferase
MVSVVTPTYNRAALLARLLTAVLSSDLPAGRLEVIVVDDGSSDDTAGVAAQFGVTYVRQRNAGPATARERGWRASSGEVIAFLDDDCVPAPDAIAKLVAALESADGAGARIQPMHPGSLVGDFFDAEGLVNHGVTETGRIRWLVTAAVAFRRSALERVGGFDTSLTRPSGEDVDLTLRLLQAGCKLVIEPAAVVYHDHRESLAELFSTYVRHGRQQRRLSQKHAIHRADLMASISRTLAPSDWVRQYRRYRLNAPAARSVAFVALRAARIAPYALGTIMGDRHKRPSNAYVTLVGSPLGARSSRIREDLGRLRDSIKIFRNWPSVLLRILLQRAAGNRADLTVVTRRGSHIVCPNDGLSRAPIYQVFADDEYSLSDLPTRLDGRPLTVVDIGAHVGAFSIAVCERSPGARVTSYEPSPSSFEYLRRNIERNGLSQGITAVERAVTGNGDSLVLYEASDASCVSTTVPGLAAPGARRTEVASIGFDDLMRHQEGEVDLLKIDCEGQEYQMVRESSADSWQRVRQLKIEYHPVPGERWDQLRAQLCTLGFQLIEDRSRGHDFGLAEFRRPALLAT